MLFAKLVSLLGCANPLPHFFRALPSCSLDFNDLLDIREF